MGHWKLSAAGCALVRASGFALAIAAALAQPVYAAPADDYARGQTAWKRGDVVAAMAALRPAAKAGHAPSQTLLAFILDKADFTEEAFALYSAAAQQNDAEGHAGMAQALLTGRGVAKDEKLAREHFSKAAALGHAASKAVLEGPLTTTGRPPRAASAPR